MFLYCYYFFLYFSFILCDEGYYTITTYKGVTCGNLNNKESYVYQQSGNKFGSCEIGYDAYGVAISSGKFTLNCNNVVNNYFQGTYTLYADLNCQSKPVTTTTWNKFALCSTNGEYTTNYTCVTNTKKPPYESLSKGDITAKSSSLSNCKNNIPYSWSWKRVKTCETPQGTEDYATYLNTCSGSTTSTTDYYYDSTCKSSYSTETTSFEQCFQLYSSSASQASPSYSNFQYGICQSKSSDPSTSTSSSNDDDEVTLSESDYGGAISGTLFSGILIGVISIILILIFCCGYKSANSGEKSNEGSNNQENNNNNVISPKSSLSEPINPGNSSA